MGLYISISDYSTDLILFDTYNEFNLMTWQGLRHGLVGQEVMHIEPEQ